MVSFFSNIGGIIYMGARLCCSRALCFSPFLFSVPLPEHELNFSQSCCEDFPPIQRRLHRSSSNLSNITMSQSSDWELCGSELLQVGGSDILVPHSPLPRGRGEEEEEEEGEGDEGEEELEG